MSHSWKTVGAGFDSRKPTEFDVQADTCQLAENEFEFGDISDPESPDTRGFREIVAQRLNRYRLFARKKKDSWDRLKTGFGDDDAAADLDSGSGHMHGPRATDPPHQKRKSVQSESPKFGPTKRHKFCSPPKKNKPLSPSLSEEKADTSIDWDDSSGESCCKTNKSPLLRPEATNETGMGASIEQHGEESTDEPQESQMISDCKSLISSIKSDATPEACSPLPSIEEREPESSVEVISNPESPVFGPMDSHQDQENTNISKTGSDWLKNIKWQPETPIRAEDTSQPTAGESSTKKQKFSRPGLAQQLQKLINQQKSATLFWQHSLNEQQKKAAGVLVVQIASLESQLGLKVAKCKVLSTPVGLNSGLVIVLFSHQVAVQLDLQPQSVVQVFPPWQKLSFPWYDCPVILCTHHCLPVEDQDVPQLSAQEPDNTQNTPDKEDHSSVQPILTVVSPKKSLKPCSLFGKDSLMEEDALKTKHRISESFLDSFESFSASSAESILIKATIQRVYCKVVANFKSHRGLPLSRLPVILGEEASSQSSSGHRQTQRQQQWFLLLQDSRGVFCELQLPLSDYSDSSVGVGSQGYSWCHHCIAEGEGKECLMSDITVMQRTNRTKLPSLFTLIDSLWPPKITPKLSSQSQHSQETCPPPGFCYILSANLTRSSLSLELENSPIYKPPNISTLSTVLQIKKNQRVSFYGKLNFAVAKTQTPIWGRLRGGSGNQNGYHIYVTDASLAALPSGGSPSASSSSLAPAHYLHVNLSNGHLLPDCLRQALQTPGRLLFFKDFCSELLMTGGSSSQVYSDNYSMLYSVVVTVDDDDTSDRATSPLSGTHHVSLSTYQKTLANSSNNNALPNLHVDSLTHELVIVSGEICGVDEETAYSWPICNHCSNAELGEEASGGESASLYCDQCGQKVQCPVYRMNLDVYLKGLVDLTSGGVSVKVNLLQSTIEHLLSSSFQSKGVYNMESIQGQFLGPALTYIQSVFSCENVKTFYLQQLQSLT